METNNREEEERRPSRVHFDITNGEVATEYIPIGQDVWQEFRPTHDLNATGDDDDGELQGDSDPTDAFLIIDDNGIAETMDQEKKDHPPFVIPLSSSHIFSATSPTTPVVNEQQERLFSAVEENDLERVRDLMCGENVAPDVNGINQQRRSPLIVAIRAKHLDMIMLILQCGAAVGDALLHAVESGSPAIVRLICSFLAPSKKALKTSIDGFAMDTSFLPAASPLMYAAMGNNHEMVKILVDYGAEIPTLEAVLSRTGEKTSYEFSLARLFWHQAISSEAYLLYATDDPVQAAFNAGRIIKKCEGEQLPHLKQGYDQLMSNLDEFITKFLRMARNSGEISTLLCEEEPRAVPKNERRSTLPQRVQDALKLEYKQVIAHPNCMHFVLDQWYHPNWQDLSLLPFLLWTILIVLAQPLFCICYIALPVQFVLRSMKTPYVRFLMQWSSRLAFIVCLMIVSIVETDDGRHDSKCEEFRSHVTTAPLPAMFLIYMWVAGLAWREIKEIYSEGIRLYFNDYFNIIDCLQIALYLTSIVTYIVSYWQYTIDDIDCHNMTTVMPVSPATTASASRLTIPREFFNYSTNNSTRFGFHIPGKPNSDTHEPTTHYPLLISGATFAIASVLSFLSSLRDIVVLAFVGPLRVSLGGMISDIVRFVFLFFFVWVSFGIGMTQLYISHDSISQMECERKGVFNPESCQSTEFNGFAKSMFTLFWSLFNPIEIENLHTEVELIGNLGLLLYVVYMTLATVVMLNALIAMMSNTYTRVEENSDIEWRVSRTTMMAEYMTKSPTLPPPFNLVPTLKTLKRIIKIPYTCCNEKAKRRAQMEQAAKANSRGRRQTKYKLFIREMTERYIMGMEADDDEDATQKMREEITSLHESLLAMRNEIHDVRTENGELCDTVRDLVHLLRQPTASVGVQTVYEEDGLPVMVTSPNHLMVPHKEDKKKRSLGKKFQRYVGSKTHKKPR